MSWNVAFIDNKLDIFLGQRQLYGRNVATEGSSTHLCKSVVRIMLG
jgi:hypothetical protein